jgi:DNA repair protein RecO (recombination protein O)
MPDKRNEKEKIRKTKCVFPAMFLLDLAIYYKNTRELQTIKDFSPYYSPADIYSNIKKSSVAVFLSEVLTSVLREESPNEHLYDFLENSIVYFDSCKKGFANFHLVFLAILSAYLGFEPAEGLLAEKLF